MFKENVCKLETPLCDFTIEDESGKKLYFDIIPSGETYHEVYLNHKKKITATNYCDCQIRLDTSNLTIGKAYYVKTTKPLEIRGSGERTYIYGRTDKDKTLAVSFPDINELIKDSSPQEQKALAEEGIVMMGYDVERVDSQTFKLVLIDRSEQYFYSTIAWVWGVTENMSDYESAVETWTYVIY